MMPSAGRRSLNRKAGAGGPGAPTITLVVPESGTPATTLDITGTNFVLGSTAFELFVASVWTPFDAVNASTTTFANADIPSVAPGAYQMRVVTAGGTGTYVNNITVL